MTACCDRRMYGLRQERGEERGVIAAVLHCRRTRGFPLGGFCGGAFSIAIEARPTSDRQAGMRPEVRLSISVLQCCSLDRSIPATLEYGARTKDPLTYGVSSSELDAPRQPHAGQYT